MVKDTSWVWLGLAAALGAAGVAIFGKLATQRGDVLSLTTVRSAIMTAVLVALLIARRGGFEPFAGDRMSWVWVTLAGICGALSWLAYFAALNRGMAGPVAALDRLSLVFVFLIAFAALGERYTWRGWAGLTLVIVGVYLIAGSQVGNPPPSGG